MIGLIILFSIPGFLVLIDFVKFIITGKRLYLKLVEKVLEVIIVIGIPIFYLSILDFGMMNDCCSDSATFSPEHRLSVYTIIAVCVLFFFYDSYRNGIAPPLLEVIINSILIIGITLNVFIAIQVEQPLWLLGNLPPILLFVISLTQNQKEVISEIQTMEIGQKNGFEKILWKFLNLKLIFKIPLLFILSLPILMIITVFLMLFGQKPDSIVSAFTDTYKHGLSQLDYMCDNVECGGHFLCSVAANGHIEIVQPLRYGERLGKPIICNRQLLVANAFEELIHEKMPKVHKLIRRNYNKVGKLIHKYYHFFNKKIVSDLTYYLMKPLEWIFILFLYTFDLKPENRISMQYISMRKREQIIKHQTAYNTV